ncbi:MAG: hemolysin III family protein [Sulfitobacter sp.]|nr:hemolysin III family protein [Sulfitobacter sp.]
MAFIAAIPAGLLLIVDADQAAERVATAIYATSLLLVFGVSAAYHRLARRPRTRALMQRLDHAMIFLLITGTYTPVCLLALPWSWGIPLLAVVATGATTGIALKLAAFTSAGRYASVLYPVLGWVAIAAAPALLSALNPTQITLFVIGGLAYTIGFPVLLLRWPDPWPRTFGYHEIWHTFTVIAAVLHFGAVATLV